MEVILKTENLTKNYPKKIALSNVNITIRKGDIYGFIGKNGAGKTTLMKLVVGLASPSEGSLELFESYNLRNGRQKIGSIIESPTFIPHLTAKQNLHVQMMLKGYKNQSQIDEVLKLVNLSDTGKKKVKNFSLGMKQRLGIAMSLLGEPEFLVLDEPTNGLDPEGIIEVRNLLKKLNKEKNLTILISSHILSELSKLATRYGIINDGILIDEFTQIELENRCQASLIIKVDNVNRAIEVLKESLYAEKISAINENTIELFGFNDKAGVVNTMLAKNDIIVYSLTNTSVDLEEYFMQMIGGNKNA